jgi:hypothetical protein
MILLQYSGVSSDKWEYDYTVACFVKWTSREGNLVNQDEDGFEICSKSLPDNMNSMA